jgi:hypothetical protein
MPNDKPEDKKSAAPPKQEAAKGAEGAKPESLSNAPARELTPEEQMALYEKDLKENDWGHQPC